jgi:hypothetical protein
VKNSCNLSGSSVIDMCAEERKLLDLTDQWQGGRLVAMPVKEITLPTFRMKVKPKKPRRRQSPCPLPPGDVEVEGVGLSMETFDTH